VQRVLEDTHCYVTSAVISGFDGTSFDYTLDSTILEIVEMQFTSGGTTYPIERLAVPDLLERRRVANPSGTPTTYVALGGANLLMFYPTPGSSATLSIYYVPVPTAMSGSTDDPSNVVFGGVPQILHRGIFYWACAECASYDDDQSSAQGQRYRDDYDKEITRYKTIIRKRAGSRNARAIVNDKRRSGRRYSDNSVYPRY
jgi:hypothetical protein